jgi:Family of unknown function (DUF5941)
MEDTIAAGLSGLTLADALDGVPRRVTGWAARRRVAPVSVSGISLALGICAAVWFSAGTRSGSVTGAVALCGSYLAARAARQLVIRTAAPADPGYAAAGRLAELCDGISEYAVYAGLAVGGAAAHWTGMWQLATATMILLAARRLIAGCGARNAPVTFIGRIFGVLGLPAGGRVLLIAVAAPVCGDRATLLFLLEWGIIAIGYALTGPRRDPGTAASPAARRDDGAIALRLGQLARGQLVPLPAALLGLAATAVLVGMGLRNLASVLVLTPVIVLLLAAPGSSHPHDGRLDWLVPGVLQAAQLLYIAALGFGFGVPGPVTFGVCALIALYYLAYAGQEDPAARPGLGWEGRMLAAGVAAMLGIATFGYLVLAAYLVVQIRSRLRASYGLGRSGPMTVTAGGQRAAAGARR